MTLSRTSLARRRLMHRPAAIAVSVAIAALVTGCGSSGDSKPKSSSSSSPSQSKSADPQAKVKAEVLRVYRGYWDAQIKAYAKASPKGTGLDKYAFDKALGKANAGLVNMQVHGNVMTGKPTISPEVTALSLDQKPKKATITDCVDVSKWVMIEKKSGKAVKLPKERLTRFVTTISARTVGDKWMIVETQQQARSC